MIKHDKDGRAGVRLMQFRLGQLWNIFRQLLSESGATE